MEGVSKPLSEMQSLLKIKLESLPSKATFPMVKAPELSILGPSALGNILEWLNCDFFFLIRMCRSIRSAESDHPAAKILEPSTRMSIIEIGASGYYNIWGKQLPVGSLDNFSNMALVVIRGCSYSSV